MSKAGSSSNTPSDQRSDSSQQLPGQSNSHDRLLEDISRIKHIPEIAKDENRRSTLLEAILNNKTERNLADNSREFRILGLNFLNRSVLMGLSRQLGQIPFLALFKGEIKELHHEERDKHRDLLAAKMQKATAEKTKNLTEKTKEKIDKKLDIRQSKVSEDKDLVIEPVLKEHKPERIPSLDDETENVDKRYNIIDKIRKATDLGLSTLSTHEHPNTLFSKLEEPQSLDLGTSEIQSAEADISIEKLKECIAKFSQGKVLVVGDLLIDELLEGKPERISREAPVLILEHVETILVPGGAANAAHNVTALGGRCHTIGVCGEDEYAKKLAILLESHKVTHDLVADSARPTTVKTRILSKTHALMQQLLRLDRISHETISPAVAARVIAKIEAIAKQYPILVLSDYRSGLITNEIIHACQKIAAINKLTLVVDAQDDFERFQNVSLITPNQPDTENAVGYKINNDSDLRRAGKDMLLLTGAQYVLITRGKEGMALFEHGQAPFNLPAFNRSIIYDVSGAGDTVVAAICLGLSTGASIQEAITLGNIAASIVVRKPGTAVTNQAEMLAALPTIDWFNK